MISSGRTIEFFKIDNHMMFTEIRPVKCSYIATEGQTELKTNKWMELEHWRELEKLIEEILKEYKESDFLYGIKKVKHNVFHDKIGKSIRLGFIYQPYKSCGCHIVTPREDISESDSENDGSHSLKDKGGRFNKFKFCVDSLVVSVCPIIEANKITKYQLSEHSNSPQRMHIKLKKALKLHDSKDQSSLVSEYFISQASHRTETKPEMGNNRQLSFRRNLRQKNRSSETLLSTNSCGNNLIIPKSISLFDTDDTSSSSFNSQKQASGRDKKKFNMISVVKQEETNKIFLGKDKLEIKKEYINIDTSTKHNLRRKKRISYEDCDDGDNPVEYDESSDFFIKINLNNLKKEHFIDDKHEEKSDVPSSVDYLNKKSISSVKTKKDLKRKKNENDLENQALSTELSRKLYSDKLSKKCPLDHDNKFFSSNSYVNQPDKSDNEEMTSVALTSLPHSNISKYSLKKSIIIQPSEPISKLNSSRMISIFGSDYPNQLFEESDEFLATGSPGNKFEGFEMNKNNIPLHKKQINNLGGKISYGELDHCSKQGKKSNLKSKKKNFETPIKEFCLDTSSYEKRCKLSVTPNKFSKDPNCNNECVNFSDKNKLHNKKGLDDNKTNSRDAISVNIQNKTKLSRNKKNIEKNLGVERIKLPGNDLDDFIGNDTPTSKKTFLNKISETMENNKPSFITKRKRERSKKVGSKIAPKNKDRQSIDLFEDSDSTDNCYLKYSRINRSYVKRREKINCNLSDKPSDDDNTISSEDESDDDVNYFKNCSNNISLPMKCPDVLAATNTGCSLQDDSYELPNLELTQVCSKTSCNEEIIPKPSHIFEIAATTGILTLENEEFLVTVTNYLSNLSLDDLIEKFHKNLNYLWSITNQEIYTSRNKNFQTPNMRRPDPSYFLCLYDTQTYSKLGDAIMKEFGKYSTSHGLGDGSSYAYFVIIPELLKKLLSDWTAHHSSNKKFLTDEECEDIFFEIALNAPDPPESFTFKF